jgi:hypothetical protein
MARHEQDREDLLTEATALVERLELRVPQQAEPLVLGVRRDGCLSVYFTPNDAYHFNTRHELRRAYQGGALLKAERGRLISLTRQRTPNAMELLPQALSDAEQAQLLTDFQRQLAELGEALNRSEGEVLRHVPADLPALDRARQWLAQIPVPIHIAASPHAR